VAAESRPVRVVRILARLNVGGPTRHVVWLTAAMEGPQFQTTLVTGVVPPGEDDMSDFAARHGVVPVVIPEMSRELSPRDAITIWKLVRLFRRLRPDVVHTHTAKAGAVGRIAGAIYRWVTPGTLIGRPRRVRLIHTFHGHVFHSYYGALKTRVFVAIEKLLARFTDDIVTITEQQRHEIHEDFGVGRADQFRVIRLGLDLADCGAATDRRAARDAAAIPHDAVVVALVGRVTAIKNHPMFLRVATTNEWSPNVRFVVYGDGNERAALEESVRAGNASDQILFAGTRSAPEIYAAIDIAALTSLNEGTPLTLIEAMANGIPCISTAVGGVVDVLGSVQETVKDAKGTFEIRERGITAASNDAPGFATGLERLLADHELRAQFAERGRSFVQSVYAKERLVADIIALYQTPRPRAAGN
jgi:glycosyltransferase involved in cell wall biosynthesis